MCSGIFSNGKSTPTQLLFEEPLKADFLLANFKLMAFYSGIQLVLYISHLHLMYIATCMCTEGQLGVRVKGHAL